MLHIAQHTGRIRAGAMALALLTVPAFVATTQAQAQQLVRLGSKRIDGKGDTDSINVDGNRRFRRIMLRVTKDNARIRNVVVHFENGEKFRPKVDEVFRPGERSRIIDLPGRDRDIDHVSFRYSNIRGGRAEVVLFGVR